MEPKAGDVRERPGTEGGEAAAADKVNRRLKKTKEICGRTRLGKDEAEYNDQLMAVRERVRRMEDDLLHEMKLREIQFDDANWCSQQLKKENDELRQKVQEV